MISIIIASVNPAFLAQVSENVKLTIGVAFEIIGIENSKGEMGLCELYNKGANQAKYDFLCFMHEDIELRTSNWGQVVVDFFQTHKLAGLLGIAGSKYKAISPSGWHVTGLAAERSNLIQQFKFREQTEHHHQINPDQLKLEQVAVVDGVWFCTTRKVLEEIKFDENTFKRFHGYDIDFSIQAGLKYEVFVTYEVLLKHFSEGNFNSEWLTETLKLHEKWIAQLPINKGDFSKKALAIGEKRTLKEFVAKAKQYDFDTKRLIDFSRKAKLFNYMGWLNFLKIRLSMGKK